MTAPSHALGVGPKPFWEGPGAIVYLGDALEILPSLPIGSERGGFDLLLTDPPYGVRATTTGHRKNALPLDAIANDESSDVGRAIASLAWTRLRIHRHAYVFGPFDLRALPGASGCCELIWDKVIPSMGDLNHPWAKQHEPIQFAMRERPKAAERRSAKSNEMLARIRAGSVLRHVRPNGVGANHHVTEKPVPLLRELIEMSSRYGDTVLDPCAGSGSTLVAAIIEGRKAIGIELEEPWAEMAARRLEEITKQVGLFAPPMRRNEGAANG